MPDSDTELGPFVEDVHAISAHLGVPTGEVVPAPVQGQVNLTLYLGTDLVLRIPRSARAAELLAKEADVIPFVQDAGVPTAELVSYDPTLRIARTPFVVLERLHDQSFAERGAELSGIRRTHESLGEILAALHQIRCSTLGAPESIPAPYTFSPLEVVQRLRETGEIASTQTGWLLECFDRLRAEGPSMADPVLLHRDVIPSNVLVDRAGNATALLDWGCAEWGSPARDLVGLPLRALTDLVSGYRTARRDKDHSDLTLERDALWFHLYLALARVLKDPSTSEDRNWAAPRLATLFDFLAYTSSASPESWPELVRGG